MRTIWPWIIMLLFSACYRNSAPLPDKQRGEGTFTRYATGFSVTDHAGLKLVQVMDPWQNSRNVVYSYVLAADQKLVPDTLKHLPFIKTPVNRVVALSTTHIAMLEQLGKTGSIVGLSGSRYIYSPEVRRRIDSGEARDVGYGESLDYESIVQLQPDVLFLYGVEGNVVATRDKLIELEIPVVFCGEYLESHPLGKAEWIRFFSLFFNQDKEAEQFFHSIDSSYSHMASLTADITNKPGVLNGLPWNDTWFMAGGQSFAAKLIADAGGDFLWKDNASTQALPLDLESVFVRAVDAEIWINPGAAAALEEIAMLDERLRDLKVVGSGKVFNNNARLNESGGNDYWESGTVRPDLVLADLIQVFHPGILNDHQFVYYRQLK